MDPKIQYHESKSISPLFDPYSSYPALVTQTADMLFYRPHYDWGPLHVVSTESGKEKCENLMVQFQSKSNNQTFDLVQVH